MEYFGVEELRDCAIRILNQCKNLRTLILRDDLIGGVCWMNNSVIDSISSTIEVFELSSEFSRCSGHENYPVLSDRLQVTDSSLIRLFERCNISKFTFSIDEESSISPFCILKCLSLVNLTDLKFFITESWCKETITDGYCDLTVIQAIAKNIRNQSRLDTVTFCSDEFFGKFNSSSLDLFSSFSSLKNFDFLPNVMNTEPTQMALSSICSIKDRSASFVPLSRLESFYWNESMKIDDLPTMLRILDFSSSSLTRLTLQIDSLFIITQLIKHISQSMREIKFLNFDYDPRLIVDKSDISYHVDTLCKNCTKLETLCIPAPILRNSDYVYIANIKSLHLSAFQLFSNLFAFKDRLSSDLSLSVISYFDSNLLMRAFNDGYFRNLVELCIVYNVETRMENRWYHQLRDVKYDNFPKHFHMDGTYSSCDMRRNEFRIEFYDQSKNTWCTD